MHRETKPGVPLCFSWFFSAFFFSFLTILLVQCPLSVVHHITPYVYYFKSHIETLIVTKGNFTMKQSKYNQNWVLNWRFQKGLTIYYDTFDISPPTCIKILPILVENTLFISIFFCLFVYLIIYLCTPNKDLYIWEQALCITVLSRNIATAYKPRPLDTHLRALSCFAHV